MSTAFTSESKAVRNKMQIPLFKEGAGRPSLWSSADMNVLVRAINALTNPTIKRGDKDDAQVADGNFLITIANADAATEGTTKQFVVKDYSFDNWLVCREWNGTDEVGEDIPVARAYTMRRTPFDGVTVDYFKEVWNGSSVDEQLLSIIYTYRTANLRHATGTINGGDPVTELQTIIPRWGAGLNIIVAAKIVDLGMFVEEEDESLTPIEWVDLNYDGRAWMEQSE